jgi:DNA-binding response OmpR family regulator
MAKLLLVDDDADMVKVVRDWLTSEHHLVEALDNSESALEHLEMFQYDLIILDWGMPKLSGLEVLQRFRAKGGETPVLMLTGKDHIDDKTTGLDSGADDYLTKPFHMTELTARVRALVRRSAGMSSSFIKVGTLTLDTLSGEIRQLGEELKLAPVEFSLLEFLMRFPNQVFSAEELLERVWSIDVEAAPQTVRSCVKRLRKKLGWTDNITTIETVHTVGYKLKAPELC